MVIVTHKFFQGPRANKALLYRGEDRKLTFVDEKPSEVSIYDVDTGLIKTVRDRVAEEHTADLAAVRHLTTLHNYLEELWHRAERKQAYDTVPRIPDFSWFLSREAHDSMAGSDDDTKTVFGFARALARGYAFLSRYDLAGKGARFVGYEHTMPLRPGTILLDATADIDGVSLIVTNRQHVDVPKVDFSNLTITHIKSNLPPRTRIANIVKQATKARPYAQWITQTIIDNSEPGELVLAVVHKGMLDHEYLPGCHRTFSNPFNLYGRKICFIHWGQGIGSNRWKHATAVFLFGEFHIPKRATVGTVLGLKDEPANSVTLAPFQSPNSGSADYLALKEGELCRWEKQLAMRGHARMIDGNGVCGVQRLYITGEFDRFIRYKDRLFPGAKVVLHQPEDRLRDGGVAALVALLYQYQGNDITTAEVKRLTGIDFQKNKKRYLSRPEVQQAMKDTGFLFQPSNAHATSNRFVRTVAEAA